MSVHVLGYEIAAAHLDRLADHVMEEASRGARLRLFAMNPAKVVQAEREPALRAALDRAEVLYSDGYGVCLAARVLTGATLPRVPGVELGRALVDRAAGQGWGVFLLGARPEVNEEARAALLREQPSLRIVGAHHGYFEPDEDETVVRRIRRASVDLLLVAFGSPRQEIWIDRHFENSGARIAMGLGGSFDVYAGRVKRAPLALRRARLEWLYRIAREPRRAGRFLRTHPPFFGKVLGQVLSSRHGE